MSRRVTGARAYLSPEELKHRMQRDPRWWVFQG
jgi:hypothetical protein